MKKLPKPPPSADGRNVPLHEFVLFAPKRWGTTREEWDKILNTQVLHEWSTNTFGEREDGQGWWHPNATGYVTLGPRDPSRATRKRKGRAARKRGEKPRSRQSAPAGWWTVIVAAYTIPQAYHFASLGEWAKDALTPGIRRLVDPSGSLVLPSALHVGTPAPQETRKLSPKGITQEAMQEIVAQSKQRRVEEKRRDEERAKTPAVNAEQVARELAEFFTALRARQPQKPGPEKNRPAASDIARTLYPDDESQGESEE